MTTLIRQEHDYGCGIAALAMICETTYDDVRKWLVDNWPGGQGDTKPGEWLTKRGTHKGVTDYYLSEHGYMWRTLYSGWKREPWPPEPFAPVHLAQVEQPSGNSHFVVMRADGVVLDPLSDEPKRLTDWPKVNNVQGIWRERSQGAEGQADKWQIAAAEAADTEPAQLRHEIAVDLAYANGHEQGREQGIEEGVRLAKAGIAAAIRAEAEPDSAFDERDSKNARRSSARTGVRKTTTRALFAKLGFVWVPVMGIGTGTTMHLAVGEVPDEAVAVQLSHHVAAVKDGAVHDTHDCTRDGDRAVYGYWRREW